MRDLYKHLASGVSLPLDERLKGHASVAEPRRLEASQWLEPKPVRALQVQRLRQLLGDIGRRGSCWLDLFCERRFEPASLRWEAEPTVDWSATRWWVLDICDREAMIWNSHKEQGAQAGIFALSDRLRRSTLLPAFARSPKRLTIWYSSFVQANG